MVKAKDPAWHDVTREVTIKLGSHAKKKEIITEIQKIALKDPVLLALTDDEPDTRTYERWISKIRKEYYREPEGDHFKEYQYPQHHLDETLPWEAAQYGIALKRHVNRPYPVVTIQAVKWAYHVALSAPDAPVEPVPDMPLISIVEIARAMAQAEKTKIVRPTDGTNWPSSFTKEDSDIGLINVNGEGTSMHDLLQELFIQQPWKTDLKYFEWTNNPLARNSPVGFFEYRGIQKPGLNPSDAQKRANEKEIGTLPGRVMGNTGLEVATFLIGKKDK